MSADEETVNRREIAYRLFASEFEDSDFSYAESDEERAPNYVITPTGARVNRLFVVGVLTEVQPVSDDVLRARVVDPTGAFVVYAGQYQPDAQAFLERTEPPAFVAVTGKARTFQPEDSDVVYTSVRPESVNEVDAETRDRWTVRTAERTLERIGTMAGALDSDVDGEELRERLAERGVPEGLAAGIPLAIDHYGTGGPYLDALRRTALEALEVVAGEREEVTDQSVAPDASGEADLSSLADLELPSPETVEEPEPGTPTADSRAGTAGGPTSETSTTEDAPGEVEASEDVTSTDEPEAPGEVEEPAVPAEDAETRTAEAGGEAEAGGSEAGTSGSEAATPESATGTEDEDGVEEDDLGDFEPGEFDLDEETREEVRSEYGTDFQSGTEVDEPGQADIETPDPEDLAESEPADVARADEPPVGAASSTETSTGESESATETVEREGEGESGAENETEPTGASADEAAELDLEDAVMDAMTELDGGDGADREQVIAAVVDEQGADPGAVEDAVQDALMNGRCYEPDDETLKPI
ncbi:RPA family protein [Halapricum desulfuricans]|uniref:RPA family protein, a subunit of RPA complex in P.furiosus n=1 Tax=Halapricum desulfuricans TaxID=2841257 RepID=A0A897MTY5_9EURY|nr:hypothetical protein [Halapricum desulfuricans]QSG05600.1 RPA family protein, a subunit of RPA complex in P.furiosus [Halapricum desulfuricans]